MAEPMTMTEASDFFYSKFPKDVARARLRAYEKDREFMRRDLERDRKVIERYTEMALKRGHQFADKFLSLYLDYLDPSKVRAEQARLERKYEQDIKNYEKQRDDLVARRKKLGQLSPAEERLLKAAEEGLQQNPSEWISKMYGGGIKGQEEVGAFAGTDSPGIYKGLERAAGVDGFFAAHFDELGLSPEELYRLYHTNPLGFEEKVDEALDEAAGLRDDLKEVATQAGRDTVLDYIQRDFNDAYKAYIKNDVIADMTDKEIDHINEQLAMFKEGGSIADMAKAIATSEAWGQTVAAAAEFFGGDFDAAEKYLRDALVGADVPMPEQVAQAQALSGQDPQGLPEAMMTREGMEAYVNRAMVSAMNDRADPSASMIAGFFNDLNRYPQDSAFRLWREMNGIVSDAPPSLAEAQRYRRQVDRTGSNWYRAKRTGDVREVTVVDERYAIPTNTAGVMAFTDGERYLTGDDLEALAAQHLKDARFVEVDISDPEVRERVFASVADKDMRDALQLVDASKQLKDRARLVYDAEEGRYAILADDLTVVHAGQVTNPGALLTDVKDPRFAAPAGSAAGFQANNPKNLLSKEEFDALVSTPEGEQATQLAAYLPAKRAKVPTKTFFGELTYLPGQDEATFSFLTTGPDGRKQTRTYSVDQIESAEKLAAGDDTYARYLERTGAEDTPRARRQFDRMFRPPLMGHGRQYTKRDRGSRRARVKAGDVTSEVEVYESEDFAPAPVDAVPDAPADGEAEKGPTTGGGAGAKKRGSGAGAKPGREGAALRGGAGAGTGRGSGVGQPSAVPTTGGGSEIPIGGRFYHTPDELQPKVTYPPFEETNPPLSDLEAAGMLEAHIPTPPAPTSDAEGYESGLDKTLAGITGTRGLPAEKVPLRKALLGLAEGVKTVFGSTADAASAHSRALKAAAEESEDEQKKKEEEAAAAAAAASSSNS